MIFTLSYVAFKLLECLAGMAHDLLRAALLLPVVLLRYVGHVVLLAGYRVVWRLVRPLAWHGGAQAAHDRIHIPMAWADRQDWLQPILRFVCWLAFVPPLRKRKGNARVLGTAEGGGA